MQRQLRLHRAEDYGRLRQTGVSHSHRLMVLSFAPNELPHNRYGFIVGKRTGKAVTRNRIRRRLREIMRQLDPQLKPGFDIVLIARPMLAEQPYDAMLRTVSELLRRAELIKEEMQ